MYNDVNRNSSSDLETPAQDIFVSPIQTVTQDGPRLDAALDNLVDSMTADDHVITQ